MLLTACAGTGWGALTTIPLIDKNRVMNLRATLSSSSFAAGVFAATERESSGTTSRVSTRFHRRSVIVAFVRRARRVRESVVAAFAQPPRVDEWAPFVVSGAHFMYFCTPGVCFSLAHPYFIAFAAACLRYAVLTMTL